MAVEVTQNLTQVTISSAGVAGVSGTSGTSGTFGNVLSSSFYISGSIIPNVADGEATSSFSLGSQTNAWKDLWISEGTIYFIASNLQTQSISLNENNEIVLSSFNLNTASLITTASYNEFTSSYGDFTSSYLLVSASIASRLDAATNEQDLSTYLSQSVFNTFSSSISDRVVELEFSASNNSGTGDGFPYEGIASITGSLNVSGSILLNGVDISGTSGTSGTSGANGTFFGTSGTSGVDGSSGTSGTTGVDGSSGTTGTSGTAGTSGTSAEGSSGTSGIDGTSGTSFSGSLDLESINSFTSSIETRVIALEDFTSSLSISGSGTAGTSGTSGTSFSGSIDLDSLNSFTSSIDIRVIALENFSSSLIVTGSGTSGIDGSSGTTGTSGTSGTSFSGSLDLDSINLFTSSIGIRVEALEDFTSSFATTGIYANLINPLEPSDTITITSTNTNVDILTANALSVTGSVSGDGFDKFATTGSNSFIGNQQITGSVYIQEGQMLAVGYNSTFASVEGFTLVQDSNGNVQLDAYNSDGSNRSAYLAINANSDESLFSVYDNTPNRINASINLSTSGSFNISTSDNTATLLINDVLYDAHLVSTSSFNTFTASAATTGSNDFVGDQTIDGILYLQDPGNDLGDTAQIVNNTDALYISSQDDRKIVLSVYSGSVYEWEFGVDGDLTVPGNINGAGNLATTGSNNFVGDQQITGSLNVSGNQSMIVLPNHTGEPSNPPSGALYFNTVNSHFYGWNGEQWKQLDN